MRSPCSSSSRAGAGAGSAETPPSAQERDSRCRSPGVQLARQRTLQVDRGERFALDRGKALACAQPSEAELITAVLPAGQHGLDDQVAQQRVGVA